MPADIHSIAFVVDGPGDTSDLAGRLVNNGLNIRSFEQLVSSRNPAGPAPIIIDTRLSIYIFIFPDKKQSHSFRRTDGTINAFIDIFKFLNHNLAFRMLTNHLPCFFNIGQQAHYSTYNGTVVLDYLKKNK